VRSVLEMERNALGPPLRATSTTFLVAYLTVFAQAMNESNEV